MTRLTEQDRRELLESNPAAHRNRDRRLCQLPPDEYLRFLTSASRLSKEKAGDRARIDGEHFLI